MSDGQPMRIDLRRDNQGQPWGFRLQGGIDFPTALSVQSVNPGSIAERAGLQPGDAVLQVNSKSSDQLEHEQAKQEIVASGNNVMLVVQRGAVKIWKPKVTPMSELRPREMNFVGDETSADLPYIQKTSLAADKQEVQHIGSGYNRTARPFNEAGVSGGRGGAPTVPAIVNAQYNTPINLYSADNTLDTFKVQSNILTAGMQGLDVNDSDQSQNSSHLPVPHASTGHQQSPSSVLLTPGGTPAFRRASPVRFPVSRGVADSDEAIESQKTAIISQLKQGDDARPQGSSASKQSRSFQMLQQELGELGELEGGDDGSRPAGIRSVKAPVYDPNQQQEIQQAQHMTCKICGTLVIGVFVRIKGEPMHPECFKCCRCGKNLKNQGYFHIEGQMYCEVHAKQAAGAGPGMQAQVVYR